MSAAGRVVLVTGPPLAGVGGVVEGLREQLPGAVVVDELAPERVPDAVVAVVSAVAPVTRSDWAPISAATAGTDLVIGVVSKIDAHRGWRDVMASDRALVATWDARRRSIPWLGVAASPDLGEAHLGALADLLRGRLNDPDLDRRNQLWRNAIRAAPVPGAVEARRALQRTRLRLLRSVRDGSAQLRAELRDAAAAVGVGGSTGFEALVAAEAQRFHADVAQAIERDIAAAATELSCAGVRGPDGEPGAVPPDVTGRPSSSRSLEGRLMTVLGVGFGLGVALAAGRLVGGLAPAWSATGSVGGAVAGLALVVWVVRARTLLHDRAILDRWVGEVVATLRWHGEAMVAERLLAAESQWSAAGLLNTAGAAPDAASRDRRLTLADVTDQYEWC